MEKMLKGTLGKHKLFLSRKYFPTEKIFSAKQFILMQLPGGVAALATLSNPTEASCTFHVKKMENSVQKQSQSCKVVMKPVSSSLLIKSWNHWMLGLEGTLKTIQFQSPAMGLDLEPVLNYLNQYFIFRNSCKKELSL